MCIRCETREKARQSLDFSRVSKPHTHITYMLRQCTSIVYIYILDNHGYVAVAIATIISFIFSCMTYHLMCSENNSPIANIVIGTEL